jgi:hypothetical protein
MNLSTLSAQAAAWQSFATPRSRFDVEKKAEQALTFSTDRGAKAFALPTKLVGTKEFQDNLADLQAFHGGPGRSGLKYAELDVSPDYDSPAELVASYGGLILGKVQGKHLGWVRPLLATRKLRFFVLQLTGGTEGKPTLGCNVVVSGIPAALEAQAAGYGWRVYRLRGAQAEYAS